MAPSLGEVKIKLIEEPYSKIRRERRLQKEDRRTEEKDHAGEKDEG
jgi:hypothetical protein